MAPSGHTVYQHLTVSDMLSYGVSLGFCDTQELTGEYLTVMTRLDEAMIKHRRDQTATDIANTPKT